EGCPPPWALARTKPQDPSRPTDARVLAVKVAFAEAVPLRLGTTVDLRITPAGLRCPPGPAAVWGRSLAPKRVRRYARNSHENEPRRGGMCRRHPAARRRAGARAARVRRPHRRPRRPRPVLLRGARRRRTSREEPLVPAEHRGRSRRRRHAD